MPKNKRSKSAGKQVNRDNRWKMHAMNHEQRILVVLLSLLSFSAFQRNWPVKCFPALFHQCHIFPRMPPVGRFPALAPVICFPAFVTRYTFSRPCTNYTFSYPCHQLHVLPRFSPGTCSPTLAPRLFTSYRVSRACQLNYVFPSFYMYQLNSSVVFLGDRYGPQWQQSSAPHSVCYANDANPDSW